MAFYIKPADGIISIESLRRFGLKRLSFLNDVLKCDGTEDFRQLISVHDTAIDSECLIEGSKQDRTSHFLLRLACSQDAHLRDFLIQAETELFCYRCCHMNTRELVHLLKSTHKFIARCLSYNSCVSNDLLSDFHMALDMIYSSTGSWKVGARKYMEECSTETFQIPFQLSLSLVAGRQVIVSGGLASVPFSSLHVVLSSLFHSVVVRGLKTAATIVPRDERIVTILQTLRGFCRQLLGKPTSPELMIEMGCLSHADVVREMRYFPPCMKHLHRVLRQRHRLRHHSRIQYTLFLKEAGLPLQEALLFWKREYSQPQLDRSGRNVKNGHSWQKDRRRYTYNIRHLYGQEGSRVNYSAHSCKYLQSYSPGPGEEGGCPFSQADSAHLKALMDIEDIHPARQNHIQSSCQAKRYTAACASLHQLKRAQLFRIVTGASIPGVDGKTVGDVGMEKRKSHPNPGKMNIPDCNVIDCEESKVLVTRVHLEDGIRNSTSIVKSGTSAIFDGFSSKNPNTSTGVESISCAISESCAIGFCRTTEHQTSVSNGVTHRTSSSCEGMGPNSSGRVNCDRHTHKRMKTSPDHLRTAIDLESNCGQIEEQCRSNPGDEVLMTADVRLLVKSEDVGAGLSSRTEHREEEPLPAGKQDFAQAMSSVEDFQSFRKPVDIYRSFKKLLSDLQALE